MSSGLSEYTHKAPPTPSSPGLLGRIGSTAKRWATKPYVVPFFGNKNYNINPLTWAANPSPKDPRDILEEIDEIATRGLKQAAVGAVTVNPIAAELQARLDQLSKTPDTENQVDPELAVGKVAHIPSLVRDNEVTRAPNLKVRAEAPPNWDEKIKEHREDLTRKLSIFTAFLQMRNRCGGLGDEDNLGLMGLVKIASEKGQTKTVWELFSDHYKDKKLTWFQKLKAGSFYWWYYQTSLISNTVDAYLDKVVTDMRKDLTSEIERNKFFKGLIENVNQFVLDDIGAAEEFAKATSGDLDKFRDIAIERFYNASLSELCKKFSEARVDKHAPKVRFFAKAQTIPFIGWFFEKFEWFVNRFIIRNLMKSTILPFALESAVTNGLEATKPHNLPFSIKLTQFITAQLENLKTEVNKNPGATSIPVPLPGTEKLADTIDNLLRDLELESLGTRPKLREKFAEVQSNKKGFVQKHVDEKVKTAIKDGIVKACHHLFNYLDKTAQSGELFSHPLGLACRVFSGDVKDPVVLKAEYIEEQLKMKRVAGQVFKKIIDDAVEKEVYGTAPETAQVNAENVFTKQQNVTKETFDKLNFLSERMTEKIAHSAQAPSPENNVQTDIASFLQIMQVFSNRKELQEEIKDLREVDQKAIWRALNPLYTRARDLEEKVLALQELQDNHTSDFAVADHLKYVQDLLESVRDQLETGTQMRYIRKPLIQPLKEKCEEIGKILGQKAPLVVHLQKCIKTLDELSESVAREEQVFLALNTLYPVRNNGQVVEQEGLIEQLLNYERGIHALGFQPKACLDEISKQLTYFRVDPEVESEEEKELKLLIGDGTNLAAKWVRLEEAMQRIYNKNEAIKNRDGTKFGETLREACHWTKDKVFKYDLVKSEDHTEMQKQAKEIKEEVSSLYSDAYHVKANLPINIPLPAVVGAVAGLAGLATGYSLASWGLTKLGFNLVGLPSIVNAGINATCLAVDGASIGLGVSKLKSGVNTGIKNTVGSEVGKITDNAYKLILSPRIYKAATTRLMKGLTATPEGA